MHLNEGLINKQLQMKLGVMENALTQMIEMTSQLYGEVEMLKKKVDLLSRKGTVTVTEQQQSNEDDVDLDISQVQKILQQQSSGPSSLGRRA